VKKYCLLNRFIKNDEDTVRLTPIQLYKLTSLSVSVGDQAKSVFQNLGEKNNPSSINSFLKSKKAQSLNNPIDKAIMESNCRYVYWVDTYYDNDIQVDQQWTYLYSIGCGSNGPNGVDEEERSEGDTGNGEESLPPMDTIMKASFYSNAKAKCALEKLMQNNFYQRTLNNFIGANKSIDLTFRLENIKQEPGFITIGNTSPSPLNWNANNIDLTIASNLIDSLPSISIGLALLHEGIHAEIYRKLLSIHGPNNLNATNFPSMFNMYLQYNLEKGFSHEFMANYYVNTIATALRQYDNNKFDIEYYKAYAWTGLKETNYYSNNLNSTFKTGIANKISVLLANRNKSNCNDQ